MPDNGREVRNIIFFFKDNSIIFSSENYLNINPRLV